MAESNGDIIVDDVSCWSKDGCIYKWWHR